MAAAVAINLILGVLYAWSVMGKALAQQWSWTKTETALPFTVATASFAITMIFAGRLQDKIGPRFVAMLGGLVLGGGLAASSAVRTPWAMALTFGLIGGIGIGLGYSATTPPTIKWFPSSKKGLVTGIVVSGVGIAAVYISPLTQYLLKIGSIPQTFLILGVAAAVLVSLLSQVLANPPANRSLHTTSNNAKPGSASPGAVNLDWNEMLRTPQFYMLWIMFVLGASAGLMIIAHVAMIAAEQAQWKWGFVPVAILAVFNTGGRVISGAISDRMGRTHTMVLAFILQAINMFAFPYYTSPALIVFGAAFTGLCYGTIFTLMPSATADFYGTKNLGVNYGSLFTAFGVAGLVGPVLGGRIRDQFGAWTYSFTISAVLLLVAAGVAWLVKAPRHTAAQRAVRPEPEIATAGSARS